MTLNDPSLKRFVQALERRVRAIEDRQQNRNAQRNKPERVMRIAITCDPTSGTYPSTGAIFPIKFVDGEFDKDLTTPNITYTNRKASAQTMVVNINGAHIAKDTRIAVWRQRGLGGEGKGEWWCDLDGCE